MVEGADIVLKEVEVLSKMSSRAQDGIVWSSQQITYPRDLGRVDDDVFPRTQLVLSIFNNSPFFEDDEIEFYVKGDFRAYEQLILNDPNSIVTPVMANVRIELDSVKKSGSTKLDVSFTALETSFGTAEDPRIRFECNGHYDPAGDGDTKFNAMIEIDQQANVTVVSTRVVGGDGELGDNSPKGFTLRIGGND
jgi:hypothetical protein